MENPQGFTLSSTSNEGKIRCFGLCNSACIGSGKKRRGFALSFDALFAVMVFIVFLGIASYSMLEAPSEHGLRLGMQKAMDDSLDLLDRERILQKFDSSIETELNKVVPVQYAYSLRIEEYRDRAGGFEKTGEKLFGSQLAIGENTEFVKGRRLFLTFESSQTERYYNAEYYVWVKE